MTSSKPAAGFWITVALVAVLVGYPLSIGPACWITSRIGLGFDSVTAAYQPITRVVKHSELARNVLNRYSRLAGGGTQRWNVSRQLDDGMWWGDP